MKKMRIILISIIIITLLLSTTGLCTKISKPKDIIESKKSKELTADSAFFTHFEISGAAYLKVCQFNVFTRLDWRTFDSEYVEPYCNYTKLFGTKEIHLNKATVGTAIAFTMFTRIKKESVDETGGYKYTITGFAYMVEFNTISD